MWEFGKQTDANCSWAEGEFEHVVGKRWCEKKRLPSQIDGNFEDKSDKSFII